MGIAPPLLEVQTGIEPVITVLQTVALPLGYWTSKGAGPYRLATGPNCNNQNIANFLNKNKLK